MYTQDDLMGTDMHWVMIDGRIYNVTQYVESLKNPLSLKIEKDSENAYLHPSLTTLIVHKLYEDAVSTGF